MAIKDMSFEELRELSKRLDQEKEFINQRIEHYNRDTQAAISRMKELQIEITHEAKDAEYQRKASCDATYGFLCNVH